MHELNVAPALRMRWLVLALDAGEPAFAPHERCGVEFSILQPVEPQEFNDHGGK